MSDESLTGATARGGIYVLVRKLATNAIRLGAIAILARELTKEEFGVVAIASIAVQLLAVFGTGGVQTYIVCDREDDWQTRVQPAFWLNLAMTTASCALVLACLPLVQWLFPAKIVTEVLLVCLADYFVDQLGMVPDALLQRRLKFRALAVRDTVRDFAIAALSVGMALGGWGVWSLVLPNLIVAPLVVIATAVMVRYRPRLPLGRPMWGRIFRYTKSVMGEQLLGFVANEADTAIVGKVMGAAVLGVYDLAYQLANLIGRNVSAVLVVVSTPALAAAFERKNGIGPPYRRMLRVLSLMTTPMLLGMFVLADDLVQIVYGSQWAEAVPLLRIFIIFTLVRAVTSPSGAIFNVVGRPELGLKIVFWFLVFLIPALVVSSYWGVVAVAVCVTVSRVIIGTISLYASLEVIGESKLRVTLELMPLFGTGIAMAVIAWGAKLGLAAVGAPLLARVVAVSIVGAALYYLLIRVFARRALDETFGLVREMLARKRKRLPAA